MHPDQILFLDQRSNAFGKTLVDALIPFARLALIFGQVEPIVEQRPQRGIGITVVIFIDIARGEIDCGGGHAIIALKIDIASAIFAFFT